MSSMTNLAVVPSGQYHQQSAFHHWQVSSYTSGWLHHLHRSRSQTLLSDAASVSPDWGSVNGTLQEII